MMVLKYLFFFSFLGLLWPLLWPNAWQSSKQIFLTFNLIYAIFLFNLSLILHLNFNLVLLNYQMLSTISFFLFNNLFSLDCFINWLSLYFSISFAFNAVDNLSLWFILLTTFLLPPSFLYSYYYVNESWKNLRLYIFLLYLLNFLLIWFFLTTNILIFYILFEIILIPVFLLILIWGSRSRKILASLYFFLYTFVGSIFFLLAIFILYSITGSYDFNILLNYSYSSEIQVLLWPCIAISLMIKIPMFPFHLWLPEAHVEAPTIGSVYLASLLLKLGSYGFLRILLPIFPYATILYTPLIQLISLLSIIYCSGIILRQIDLKKIIAYSSIIHMNMAIFGLFTYNIYGLQGSILLMFAHGLSSGALFLLIGFLYERCKTRLIFYFSGLFTIMPLFSSYFIFFSFCNIGFPGTINFISELLLIIGIINYSLISKSFLFAFIISLGLFSSVCYSIWLINKLLFGNLKSHLLEIDDLTDREILILLPFLIYILVFGLNSYILQFTLNYSQKLLNLFIIL